MTDAYVKLRLEIKRKLDSNVCPKCNNQNEMHAKFCGNCGQNLIELKKAFYDKNSSALDDLLIFNSNQSNGLQVENIKIYPGDVDKPYKIVGSISVRADSSLFSKTATMDDANGRLREEAIKLGANAIINVRYERSRTTSWRGVKAWGLGIIIESDEKKCPFCAELIKKEAIKCKHCGSNLIN